MTMQIHPLRYECAVDHAPGKVILILRRDVAPPGMELFGFELSVQDARHMLDDLPEQIRRAGSSPE